MKTPPNPPQNASWYAKGTAGHETHGQSAVYGPDGKDIAIVYDGKAHAALIAAAPDLLAACEQVLDYLERNVSIVDAYPPNKILRQAIAKASA